MSTSSLIAPILAVSGIGAAGVGGVNLIKWRNFEGAHPTVDSLLYEDGFSGNPASHLIHVKGTVSKQEKGMDLKGMGCFQRMFPGVEINNKNEVSENDQITVKLRDGYKANEENGEEGAAEEEAYAGCAIMDLQSVTPQKGTGTDYFYYFKTELVIKGENSAVALWAGFTNRPVDKKTAQNGGRFKYSFVYKAISLTKKDNTGSINDGYQGYHYSENYSSSGGKGGFYIKPPGVGNKKEDYWLYNATFNERDFVPHRTGMGLWVVDEESDEDDFGLFSDIQAYRYNSTYSEVLGKSAPSNEDKVFETSNKNKFGYANVKTFYDKTRGWVTSSNEPVDISGGLDSWYSPFMHGSGKWREMREGCNDLSYTRGKNVKTDKNLALAKDLCYSKTY